MCFILPDSEGARKRATTNVYCDAITQLAELGHSIKEIAHTLFLAPTTVIMCLREMVATMPAPLIGAAKALANGLESEAGK